MRVLVTGAGGFVGRCVAEYLHASGVDVVGTVHSRGIDSAFRTVRLDLAEAWPDMGFFDAIIHIAGSIPPPLQGQGFCVYKRNNVDTMEQLIAYAKGQGISRVVFFSTIGIYGEFREARLDEYSDRINPDAYGLTKYLAECLLQTEEAIESLSLRLPGIIGYSGRGRWLSETIEKFRRHEPVKIYAPDFATRNFVWVEDLAKFIIRLLTIEKWYYPVVCLASHEKVTVRTLVEEIKRRTGSRSEIIVDNRLRVPFCIDDSRAVEMGYTSISPLEMVRRMCEA